jgi:hypothetical protein
MAEKPPPDDRDFLDRFRGCVSLVIGSRSIGLGRDRIHTECRQKSQRTDLRAKSGFPPRAAWSRAFEDGFCHGTIRRRTYESSSDSHPPKVGRFAADFAEAYHSAKSQSG